MGTRPEIIRLSRLIPLLDKFTDHTLVHTGQNFDLQLSDVFFDDLNIRPPDFYLDTVNSSFASQMGDTIKGIERILSTIKPDAVMILGDTNSAVAAIVAERMLIPVYHMEAGNRSFDRNVPEELNRRMVDHVSSFNLAYSEHSVRNLLREGLEPRRVYKTGSPIREIVDHYQDKILDSKAVSEQGLEPKKYILASLHRQETVDFPHRLNMALTSLEALGNHLEIPVVLSTHPRTQARNPNWEDFPRIKVQQPFGFTDYASLQRNAYCVVSDSGTISEESAVMGFPAVTLRNSMERPEALEVGSILMCGIEGRQILECVDLAATSALPVGPKDYEIPDFSRTVLSILLSTASLHHEWAGIRRL